MELMRPNAQERPWLRARGGRERRGRDGVRTPVARDNIYSRIQFGMRRENAIAKLCHSLLAANGAKLAHDGVIEQVTWSRSTPLNASRRGSAFRSRRHTACRARTARPPDRRVRFIPKVVVTTTTSPSYGSQVTMLHSSTCCIDGRPARNVSKHVPCLRMEWRDSVLCHPSREK